VQPSLEQFLKVYNKMRDTLRQLDKAHNDNKAPILEQGEKIETAIINQLLNDEDMKSLVFFYNTGRDELDAIDEQFKKEKAHVMLRQEKLEDAIFAILRKTNSDSIKTEHGTAFTSTQSSVKVADWRVFLGQVIEDALTKAAVDASAEIGVQYDPDDFKVLLRHLQEQESWSLIKRAASKDAVKAYIEEHKKPVPGVDFDQRLQVSVRRK
jgi:hypothetical protein